MKQVVVVFGEAEKGAFKTPHLFQKIPELVDSLGNPPTESQGLYFAVQSILYNRDLIYFRVSEEGFSAIDYLAGLKLLKEQEKIKKIHAICMPGVGDPEIISSTNRLLTIHKCVLITQPKDLYDFLTSTN